MSKIRKIINKLSGKNSVALYNHLINTIIYVIIRKVKKSYGLYQDIDFPEFEYEKQQSIARSCEDRLNIILPHIIESDGCFLDIGSNMGYYCFELQKLGKLCHGIEQDRNYTALTNLLSIKYNLENVAFQNCIFNQDTVKKMPAYDGVLFFSVFHHLVKKHGFSETDKLMRLLVIKVNRIMFFESGFPEEEHLWGNENFNFIKSYESSTQWVFEYFKSLGFVNVEKIGEVDNHLSSVNRVIFKCVKW